ncbi:MAG: hypothetical protein IPM46_01110 [Flavobacteriales bacterium]|nr:hypothetical protein [Flavobacteriales bacterium]
MHHRLYDQPDLRSISLDSFLTQLTDSISAMHSDQHSTVSISVDAQGLKCDQGHRDRARHHRVRAGHQCLPACLPARHGRPYRANGVARGGRPAPPGGDQQWRAPATRTAHRTGKLGLEIVEALAEQLDGSLHMRTDGQAAFEVLFRMRKRKLHRTPTGPRATSRPPLARSRPSSATFASNPATTACRSAFARSSCAWRNCNPVIWPAWNNSRVRSKLSRAVETASPCIRSTSRWLLQAVNALRTSRST